jgi:hypothetical protein
MIAFRNMVMNLCVPYKYVVSCLLELLSIAREDPPPCVYIQNHKKLSNFKCLFLLIYCTYSTGSDIITPIKHTRFCSHEENKCVIIVQSI